MKMKRVFLYTAIILAITCTAVIIADDMYLGDTGDKIIATKFQADSLLATTGIKSAGGIWGDVINIEGNCVFHSSAGGGMEIDFLFGDAYLENFNLGGGFYHRGQAVGGGSVVNFSILDYLGFTFRASNSTILVGDNTGIDVTGDVNATTFSGGNVANWDAAYTHISSNGSDHSYIDQSVTTLASPAFNGLTIATGQHLMFGARQIDNGNDGINVLSASDGTPDSLIVCCTNNVGIDRHHDAIAQRLEVNGNIFLNSSLYFDNAMTTYSTFTSADRITFDDATNTYSFYADVWGYNSKINCGHLRTYRNIITDDTLKFTDANTEIYEDGSGNLTFKDAVAGTKILSDVINQIDGDGTVGRVLRRIRLNIEDGTNANTIKCNVIDIWNGDTIAVTDNIVKNGTTGDFTLSANGNLLKIESTGLTGNAIMSFGTPYFIFSSAFVTVYSLEGDIINSFYNLSTGALVDLTALVDTGAVGVDVLYMTDA